MDDQLQPISADAHHLGSCTAHAFDSLVMKLTGCSNGEQQTTSFNSNVYMTRAWKPHPRLKGAVIIALHLLQKISSVEHMNAADPGNNERLKDGPDPAPPNSAFDGEGEKKCINLQSPSPR